MAAFDVRSAREAVKIMREIKEEIRRALKAEAALHPPEERAHDSTLICRHIMEHPLWASAASLLLFCPIGVEPGLRSACFEALQRRKLVAFPKYLPDTGDYGAFQVTDPTRELLPGRFAVPEPVDSCTRLELNKLDLIFIPGLGFSFDGARLGRGKGYYDRLLANLSATKCGVAYDWQIVAGIPREAHDVQVDCVVTPQAWHEVTRQS